jgi:hypothetical protein
MTITASSTTVVAPRGRRRWPVAAAWAVVALSAVYATWRGGIALDLMFTVMKVVGLFTDDEVLPFEPDWPGMLRRSAAGAVGVAVAVAAVRAQRRGRGACVRCGRTGARSQDPRQIMTWAAYASVVPALAYASLKLHWGFGGTVGLEDPTLFEGVRPWTPGFGDTVVMAAVGVAVVLAMAHGRPRVPRWVLLAPAMVSLLLLVPVGLIGTVGAVAAVASGEFADRAGGLAPWVAAGIYPTFLTWGILVAVVTVGYHHRTRGRCRRCRRD